MRRILALAVPLALAACDQPPTKEIAAAEAQVEQARQAGAERFAPERWREAEAALGAARAKVQQKDYRGALSSANDAADKARGAVSAVAAARANAKGSAELAQREIGVFLEEVDQVRQEAVTAKVPDEAFADVQARVDEVREGLTRVSDTLSRGEVLDAQKTAAELRAQAAALPEAFRAARTAWEEAHPKGRRPRR
jgi:hypothetical protein